MLAGLKVMNFGAFVNLTPGKDGLVHVSKLGRGKRLETAEEAISVGDKITVVVREVDRAGKISLDPVWEGETPPTREELEAATREARESRRDRPERPRERSDRPRDRFDGGGDRPRRPRRRIRRESDSDRE